MSWCVKPFDRGIGNGRFAAPSYGYRYGYTYMLCLSGALHSRAAYSAAAQGYRAAYGGPAQGYYAGKMSAGTSYGCALFAVRVNEFDDERLITMCQRKEPTTKKPH